MYFRRIAGLLGEQVDPAGAIVVSPNNLVAFFILAGTPTQTGAAEALMAEYCRRVSLRCCERII